MGVFLCPTLRVLAACASAALAKNSPPDCFLHARTVLQEIIILSIQTLRWKHLGVFLCPTLRVLAACASAALAKNSPPDCFLHARTVLQEIIILSIQTLRWKHLGVFLCPTLRVLAACASAALAKNSPPDCFLHTRTVLKKIIFYLSKHSGRNAWVFFLYTALLHLIIYII